MADNKKCKHIKDDGTACGAFSMAGQEYCYLHNPDISDSEKKQGQTRGGANRALVITEPMPAMTLTTPKDAVLLIAETINQVRAGQLDIRVANCLGVLAGHFLKALEVSQLNDKVEFIERMVIERRTKRG